MLAEIYADLKRRRVYRTAAIYAAAAWGLTEASTTVFEHLNVPEWASMLVVIVFLLGFPVAMYLAWVFDITADGIRRTQPMGMRGWGAITLSAVLLIGGTGLLFWLLYEPGTQRADESKISVEASALPEDTIAVLPFVIAQGQEESIYFAEGVAETLLAQLSNFTSLRVIARDSSFSLRDPTLDATKKARLLNAAYLLDGSVQLAGSQIRIIVRLLDGENGEYLWSETLNGGIDEVFQMQDRITESVVARLSSRQAVESQGRISAGMTSNSEAYDFYLRGQYEFNDRSPEALKRAIDDFDQAIQLDGDFALAYFGRANATSYLSGATFQGWEDEDQDPIRDDWMDYVRPFEYREESAALEQRIGLDIQRSIELAPELSDGYTASGLLALRMRKFEKATADLKRAIELNPNNALAHQLLGLLKMEISQYDFAIQELETALTLNPLSVSLHMDLGRAYFFSGQNNRSIAHFETLRRIAPNRYSWAFIRYPLFHSGQHLRFAKLALDTISEVRAGRLGEPWWDGDFHQWAFIFHRVYLGDVVSAARAARESSKISMVDGRLVWTAKLKESIEPKEIWYHDHLWASMFRFNFVIHNNHFEDAYNYIKELINSAPNGMRVSPIAHTYAGRYALVLGKCGAAKRHFEAAKEDLAPEDWPYSNVHLDYLHGHVDAIDYAIALRCLGEEENARELIDGTIDWLDEMEASGYGVSQIPVVRAKAHALRSEPDKAIEYLEQYAALPGPLLTGIVNDPAFESIEDDPRFQAIVGTIKEKNRVILEQIDRAVEESGLDF